jgi:hypothetical protein
MSEGRLDTIVVGCFGTLGKVLVQVTAPPRKVHIVVRSPYSTYKYLMDLGKRHKPAGRGGHKSLKIIQRHESRGTESRGTESGVRSN